MSLNARYMSEPEVAQPMAPRTTEQCGKPTLLACFFKKIHFVCDKWILPYRYFLYYFTLAAYQSPNYEENYSFLLTNVSFSTIVDQ